MGCLYRTLFFFYLFFLSLIITKFKVFQCGFSLAACVFFLLILFVVALSFVSSILVMAHSRWKSHSKQPIAYIRTFNSNSDWNQQIQIEERKKICHWLNGMWKLWLPHFFFLLLLTVFISLAHITCLYYLNYFYHFCLLF